MAEETSKSVTFNRVTYVVLIPELKEYEAAQLKSKLWYNLEEMIRFRDKYIEESTQCITVSDRTDPP